MVCGQKFVPVVNAGPDIVLRHSFDLKASASERVQVKIEPPRFDEDAISKRTVRFHALTVVENGSIRRIAGIAPDDALRQVIYDPHRFIENPLIWLGAGIADVSRIDEQLAPGPQD